MSMKSEAAVRRKLKQVLFRHLKQDLERNFQKLPHMCGLNGKPQGPGLPRMCLLGANLPGTWQGQVCDASVDGGKEQARTCPYWKPLRTKEEIKDEFKALVAKNRAAVASRFPDAAALLWVLDEDTALDFDATEPEDLGDPEDLEDPEEAT
jgi:hypothetical protein